MRCALTAKCLSAWEVNARRQAQVCIRAVLRMKSMRVAAAVSRWVEFATEMRRLRRVLGNPVFTG